MRVNTLPVSLVMTLVNERNGIVAFLEDLRGQDFLPEEIVIVDGGSSDGTPEAVRTWAPPEGVTVRVLESPGANISTGRNTAIDMASHDFIIVTDGGTRLSKSWVSDMFRALSAGHDIVGGFFSPSDTGTPFEAALARIILPTLDEVRAETFLPSSRSLGMTKAAWRAVGGYPEWLDYCEDLVLDLTMQEGGMAFAFAPSAVATWNARPSIKAFAKQYFRYARGDGKALLFTERHLTRYVFYSSLCAIVVAVARVYRNPSLVLASAFGLEVLASSRYLRRAVHGLRHDGTPWFGVALAPAIQLIGDVSKMCGFPVGLYWRVRHGWKHPIAPRVGQWRVSNVVDE